MHGLAEHWRNELSGMGTLRRNTRSRRGFGHEIGAKNSLNRSEKVLWRKMSLTHGCGDIRVPSQLLSDR